MPLLLRVIRKSRWSKKPWLEEGKAQANALVDLQPKENKLSFWHIEEGESNFNQVVAAIAATRDSPSNFDYAIFDQALLMTVGVGVKKTVGHTFHKQVDASWHCDIVELSAENVAEIANIIMQHGTKNRIWEREVTALVEQELNSGVIDVNPLMERLEAKGKSNWLKKLVS